MSKKTIHNSRGKFNKTLFRALHTIKRAVCGDSSKISAPRVVAFVLLLTVLQYAHAEFLTSDAFVIETVKVFPSRVSANGWDNVETVTFQNLDNYSLYQDFNKINSATLRLSDVLKESSKTKEISADRSNDIENIQVTDTSSTTEVEIVQEVEESPIYIQDVLQTTTTSTVEGLDEEVSESQSEEVNEPDVSVTDEEFDQPEPQETNSTTTVQREAKSLFALAVGSITDLLLSTSSNESTTINVGETIQVTTTTNELSIELLETTEQVLEVDTELPTTTAEETVVPVPVGENASATPVSPAVEDELESEELPVQEDEPDAEVESDFLDLNNSTSTPATTLCTENCTLHNILLEDFGFPLDEGVEMSGAQLRVSMAGKVKPSSDYAPEVKIRYSFDDAGSWQEAGSIIIEDEASNSINGGYYLFALSEVLNEEALSQLKVELVYQGSPSVLDDLFIDSVWLEVFTLKPPVDVAPVSIADLLADDGYNQEPLSGDILVLPDGKEISITHTDGNKDETLIIKSDEERYHGVSEVTTYFSVTNTSDNEDDFTVQTYFPKAKGEVTNLEVFNQNKPREAVIPEYRPYVYHCEAGWEYDGEFEVGSLEDLSKQLSIPVSIAATTSLSTTTLDNVVPVESEVEFALPTTTIATSTGIIDFSSTSANTTTVLRRLMGPSVLLQYSTTTEISTATSSEPEPKTEVVVSGEDSDLVSGYSCRNTNVVRKCDELDGANTSCRVNSVKVAEHKVTQYAPGWDKTNTEAGSMPAPGLLKRIASFIGFGPDRKEVPEQFEPRMHTNETYTIQPGETLYFKMDIEFPPFSSGEYWIEAIGDSEYGLLDPFWSSQWMYRIPIKVTNPTGSDQTEYQVFFELDSSLSDFWSNVNSDGSDIRFIQELASSNFSNEGTAINNWLDFDFGHRVPIEIPAGTVTEDLTDFPVSVDLSTFDSTFWSNVKADGGDIRVYTTDGTELAIDLTEINTTTETGALHFLADTIPANGASTFYMYFDDASLSGYASTSPLGSQAVWANYNAVYHFNDDPTIVGNVIVDATGNGRDITVTSAAFATTSGQFGTAIDLGSGAGYLENSAWNFQGGNPLYVTGSYLMTAADGEALWQWGTGNQPSPIRWQPWYAADDGRFTFDNTSGDEYVNRVYNATTSWHGFGNIGATSTSQNNYVYEDGVLVHTLLQSTANASNTTGGGFQIGRLGGGGSWSGLLDELRVATSTRSNAWVRAESVNLYAPTQFYVPRQTQSPNNSSSLNWYSTSWDQRVRLSIPAASLTEDLTDFPVYLDLSTLGSAFHAGVASDGRDIRITIGDGVTEVPYELVSINTGSGVGELYFKADLSHTAANDFYVYFDNPDVSAYARTDMYGSDQVWTNAFEAVYHFEEDAAGTGNPDVYKDSTSNQYDGDDETSSNDTVGRIGGGLELGDASSDYVALPYQVLDGVTDVTVSGFYKVPVAAANDERTILSGANAIEDDEFRLQLEYDGSGADEFHFTHSNGTEGTTYDDSQIWGDDEWDHFMVVGDDAADQVDFYLNGIPDAENINSPQTIDALDIAPSGLVIGQEQTAISNFDATNGFVGLLDEIRIVSAVRSEGWAAAEANNLISPTTFIATSTTETLQATDFVELDFWLQHFDSTGEEADIWVQVEDLPAGEETIIWLYYGNSGASSASDEMSTFTYSTTTDIFYVVDDHGATSISVQSLIDNNIVSFDGGTEITLNQGESTTFSSSIDGNSVISVLGPISGTVTGSGNDGSDMLAPISFATTSHAVATARANQRIYVHAPFASTTVRTYTGASASADATINVATGTASTITATNPGGTQGVDGSGWVVEASAPVLVMHRSDTPGDGLVAYPPTTRDLFGINSNFMHISALASNPDPLASCSTGTGGTVSGITRGDHEADASCSAAAEGAGSAVRLSAQSSPITALQQADSDGNESSVYWPQHEFGTWYAMTNVSAYAAVVCSPRFGTVELTVLDSLGDPVETGTCTPGASTPGKAYFDNGSGSGDGTNYTAGHQIVATNGIPFYVMYEDTAGESTGDEKNISGPVQARKFGSEYAGYIFGPQELANDAEWEQLSFRWYENGGGITPTTTWQISGEGVTEGEAITGAGAVDNGDQLRLRINLEASNATGSVNTNAFTLQFSTAESGQCSLATSWYDLGEQGSTTAAFSGYNNSGVSDGVTLSTTTLASSTILGTYEERNYSDFLPADVPIGDVVEYDWVIEATNIVVNTNYCFRLTRAQGSELDTYTLYPELETVGPPSTPELYVFFDNERTTSLTPVLEFSASDNAGDDIDYQIQIDDDYDFSSPNINRNSNTPPTNQFVNVNTPSDKTPFDSGATIRFTAPTALSPTTTYYWRVRANDPNGSATTSDWSTPFSFTTDTVITTSEWFQTTSEQFATNELTGLSTSTDEVSVTASPGVMTTPGIDFDDATIGNAWGEVDWNDTETSGEITIQVEYNDNGTWRLVPNSLIADNDIGTTTGPINLLDLDTGTYNEIRLVATFTGATLSLQDWVVRWGLRVETPTQGDPFDNQKINNTTPTFDFVSTDPQGDDLEYEISFSQDIDFITGTSTYNSSTSVQFVGSSPYTSGDTVLFNSPGGLFANGETWWWRTRARDPYAGNSWSPWATPDAFTVDTAITESTWFQTTEDQFNQGTLEGVIASTSGSVEVTDQIGEYGTITLTDNNWTTVNTQISYSNMIVVASPEYNVTGASDGRTPRVRNKTSDSFEIKVDDHSGFTGSTIVDYIVMEAGEWTLDDGGTGITILAATEASVDEEITDNYNTSNNGRTVSISTSFGTDPIALATISSDNDSTWAGVHLDDGTANLEWDGGDIRLALAKSVSSLTHSGGEDIDYILFDQGSGSNNGTAFETVWVQDDVQDSFGNPGHNFTLSSFSSEPAVTVMHQNSEGGGNGSFALKDLSGTNNSTNLFVSVIEIGAGANGHGGNETVGVIAFENSSGILSRLSGGNLSGTIAGEDIIFSDGTGPKFDNFSWSSTTPGNSDITIQMQYQVSEGVYALIPDSQIPGNSVGTSSSPIDLTSVDINLYPQIRAFATLTCNAGDCPTLDDWQLEWSEGVSMSGTLHEYDRLTAVATGTIMAAVNGVTVVSSTTVSGGLWTLPNVTAFDGDIVTVWVDGATETEEAVAVFVYDGLGDITGVELFEQYLSISADEEATTTNALLALGDNFAIGDEDVFFEVDGFNNLVVCAVGSCEDANMYVGPNNVYIPESTGGTVITTHDFVNDGIVEFDSNTINLTGSWDNNATTSIDTATVNLTAAAGTESISSIESPLSFYALSFNSGGSAVFTIGDDLDLANNLTVASGTFSRADYDVTVAGSVTTGVGGYWSGTGTTTFDGAGAKTWTDNNPVSQNIGNVIIDGASTFVSVTTDVSAYDIIIGANDTLAGGAGNTLYVAGDWTNNGTFTAGTSIVEIVNDNRTYPPVVPGSADWYADTDFADRVPLTIDSDEVPGTLTNFPVYVDLSHLGSDFWDDVQVDGDDIRVTKSDGQTELPYELVAFDASAKTGELHFLADTVSGTASTTFYLYHNNPSASAYAAVDTYGRNAVWSEYEAVYHFEEDPTAVTNTIVDSTGSGYDLLVEGAGLSSSTGQLGKSVSLIGSAGLLRAAGFRWATGSPLTTSGWYKLAAVDAEAVWQFGTGAQPDQLFFRPWYGGNNGEFDFGNTTGDTYSFTPRDTSNWNHFFTIGATSTSDFNYVYHDDILRETQAQTVTYPGNTDGNGLQVGRQGTAGSFEGEIDELRFVGVIRNTDWMTAEYINQYTPTVFYATSSVQTYVPDLVIDEATHNITAGGSAFNDLTFDDATTTPAFTEASVVVNGDFTIATGTVTLPSAKLTVGGSFLNSGNFMHNNAEVEFTSGSPETISLNGTQFLNAFYNLTFDGSGTFTFTDTHATTSNDLVIDDGTVVFPAGVLTIGGTLQNNGATFNANGGTVRFSSADNENVIAGSSSFNDVEFGLSYNSGGWYDAAWGERLLIQIASTSVQGTQTNFPVYVNLADLGTDFWSGVQLTGADIRITASDGITEVPVEIVSIDTALETGELHFLAPSVTNLFDTNFYLYFNNASAIMPDSDSTYGSENVWVGYEAVYHFEEDVTLGVTDASRNGKDLSPSVGTPSTTAGLLGTALDTTASNVMMEDSDWTWTSGEDLVSSGLYFMTNTDTGALWQFGDGSGSNNGTYLAFMPNYDLTNRGRHFFGITSGADYTVSPYDNTKWHHFTTIGRAADGASNEIYEDNLLQDVVTQITTSANPTNTGLKIGRYQGGTYSEIQIDELRFATTTPSTNRISTEYNNLTDSVNFYATSSQSYLDVVPSFTLNQSLTDVDGDVTIYYSNLVAPTTNFTIGGSALNIGGSFDPNNSTVTFNSTDTGETVDFGDGAFYNLSFNGIGGGWLISTTTVNNNASLVTGASFTLATNTVMSVGGIFSNAFAAAATDWTNSTLRLTGGDYTVTDRLDAGDTYATVVVSGDSDIVIWNSDISTSSVRDTSSIYLPDFAGQDGTLRIYGDYTRTSGAEYWSYDTDFDGTDLTGGGERAVSVEIGRGANIYLATSTTLELNGVSTATTTVSAISGIYALTVNAGTIDANYFSIQGTGKNGLQLTGGTTVSNLSNAEFSVAAGRTGLTVDADTINAQPASEFTKINFSTSTAGGIYESAWSDQVIITIQSDVINEDLTEYVVYVDLSTLGASFWSGVQSDGRDIRVTTDAGVELPIDLVEINATAQTGELHFLASNISASEDTAFYLHFNNPSALAYSADDEFGANNVWINYEAVYHFNEDPNVRITDMTGNNRDLFTTVGTAATTSGQFGTALDTTGSNVVLENTTWTWTAGEDLVSTGLYYQTAFDTGALWAWGSSCPTDNCLAFLPWYNTATQGYHRFGETGGNDYYFTRNNTIWHHFTTLGRATDGESVDVYEDNVLRDTYLQTPTGANPSQTGLQIGRYGGGTYMDIQIDELRFATTVPSTNRIDAEYTNFASSTTFYSTSSAQSFFYNVTADGVPTTFWLFSNGTGNIYGEAFDNDDGDPGSIQWDDSNFAVTISGVVYSDDGVTPMSAPVCNGSTEVVRVVLDGATTYTAPCDPLDGSYEVTGIVYTGEPQITAYISSHATETQTNVGMYDETSGIGIVASNLMTVARPSVVDNSVLVLIAGKDDDINFNAPPVGWTAIDTLGNTTGDDIATGIWYKVVASASTEPTTYDFSVTDNGEEFSYWMGSLVNVDTVTPVDVASVWTKYQNTAAPDASEITTVTNGAMVFSAWYVFNDDEVVPPVYGWQRRATNIIGAANNLSVSSQLFETAGNTGSSTLISVIDSRESHAGQFAFRPAANPTATSSVVAAVVTKTPIGNSSPYEVVTERDQRTGFGTVAAASTFAVEMPVVEDGDVLVAIVGREDDFTVTPPAGWLTGDVRAETTGNDMYTGVWYKVVTNAGAEPSSYDFTSNDTGVEEYSYWVGSFSGVDTTNVFDVAPLWSNLQDTSSPSAPAITTLRDGAYAIASWYVIDDNELDMPGAPWTTLAQDIELANRLLSVAGRSMTAAGNTGPATLTGGSTDDVNVIQFSLNPAAISVADNITDMDLYQDRLIVRHENIAPITISDLLIFDNDDENDLPFTATAGSPNDLTIESGSGLYVWESKEFAPNGTINLLGRGSTTPDGSFNLGVNSTFTSSSTYPITIGGSLYAESGATFDGASSLVTFAATTTGQQIGSGASTTITFYDLEFTGAGGGWAIQTPIVSLTDMLVSTGTVSGISNITVETGSLTGNGLVDMTGGTTQIKLANTLGGSREWNFYNLRLGNGSNSGITKRATNATTTVRNILTISSAHFLYAYGSTWDIQGSGNTFVKSGTLLQGTSTIRYSGTTPNITRTTYNNLVIDTESGGSVAAVAPVTGLQVLGNLTVGALGTSTLNVTTNDPLLAVGGDVYIGSLGTIEASNTNLLDVFGSWENDGVFNANGGTVEFLSTGVATVAAGSSTFATVLVQGAGDFTFTESATATENFDLDAGSFQLANGETLSVGGEFTNSMNDADTTWTNTTLYLYSGTAYTINSKTTSDTYNTITVGANTHPRLWNSTSTVVNTNGISSLYSMDHQGVDGDLYIFGDLVSSNYNDYWSYAEDFDGTALGVSARVANVQVENGGSVLYTGGNLTIHGSSTASTTINAQGVGTYTLTIGGTTVVDLLHTVIRETTSDGLIFTGSPDVTDMYYADFEVAIPDGTAMTVGASVIDINPAREFNRVGLATTTVINAYNVTATGTSASAWRFVNVIGNLGGEAKDVDPGGDPGYITWEDSAAIINISGTVYSDEGSTPMGVAVCDGTTGNIRLSVNGTTFATTTCANGTGVYSFTGISYGLGNTLTVYIDDETENAVTVTQDPISSISNFDLYQDRVIIKHESAAPMTIADMGTWDSDDDADILFDVETAGTDTLVLPADTKLIVWNSKKFTPGGNVTVSGGGAGAAHDGTLELRTGATFTGGTGEIHTIGGSLISGSSAVFSAGQSTTTFTTTGAARTIDTNESGFYNLNLTGSGSWTVSDTNLSVANDYTQTAGAITLPAATTTIGGSFTASGGSWDANGGELYFTATDTGNNITFGGSDAATVRFNGSGGSWAMSDVNATTTAAFLVVNGTVMLPSGKLAVGDNFIISDAVAHNSGEVFLYGTGGSNFFTVSGNDLFDLTIDAGVGDYVFTDASATLLGDLTISTGTLTAGAGTLSIGGSFNATTGTFGNNGGTVQFNSSDTGELIDFGSNELHNVVFAGPTGGWTILGDATTTNNFTLSSGSSFTQATATVLYVGGVFTNNIGGSATEWIGSTLVLDSGTEYETNLKSTPTEQYNIIQLGENTDISSWNAAATSTIIPTNSSWYSQDHAGNNGDLYIYGDYHIPVTTEYWSYAIDFDGVALGGSPRAVNVRIASSSTVSVDGGVLNMVGIANSTSTVSNQGTGRYTFVVDGGTFNGDYYSYRNLDSLGLRLLGASTITSLDNGDFEQDADSTVLITLASTTLNTNAGLSITNTRFDNGAFINGVNVSLDATTTNSWSFTGSIGNLWGESYDVDGTDDCSSIRWDDSLCLLTEQAHYRWRNDDGGEGAPPGTWYDSNWGARKRVRIINDDAATYIDAAVKLDVTYDSDMQTDFEDLRFTDETGTTTIDYWIERFTTGVEADVWIRVPAMATSSVTEVYMYYGNVSATSSADASNVFTIYDDFDDNNLTEYAGDTTKFATAGTYAFGGGYGLDASPDPSDVTTDGIARTDITVSQGQIIRYMQYVDTSAGSSDEVCTMFGVQSPVTNNSNYAVCLEQFGTDRVSLVEDVENTDSTGTVLASSTITFSTGWYEVEIDWQTDNTIDVTVYDSTGSIAATTSASDGSKTSGGIGFTFWEQHGGWDSYLAWPRTATKPTVLFGAEQVDGGASWAAAQNTPVGGFAFGETIRLRMGIENSGLAIENQNFQLEYAPKLTAPSCQAVSSGSYTAVPVAASCGASELCMTTSASTTDGDPTTDHLLTDAGDFVVGEIVANSSNETSNIDIDQNEYTEVEYAFNLTVNAVNDAYCFRVTDSGALLDSYAVIPELTLAFDPILDTIYFNEGLDIVVSPGGTTTILATTTVTDYNGYTDLLSATSTFYTTTATAACTPDNNNCYIASSTDCSFSACAGNSCLLTCTADFQFHADPTDADGGEFWQAFIEVRDMAGGVDFGTSVGIDLLTMRALDVQNGIGYGTVDINENTGTYNPTVPIINIGNEAIDVQISGTDMTDGVTSVISSTQQVFATSTFDYASCVSCQPLQVTGTNVEVDLNKPTSTSPAVTDEIYWGIEVPFGTASNPHSGVNTFTAIAD